MGFPRKEYWSGLPFPSPGDLPDPGIKPVSPTSPASASSFFTIEPPRNPTKAMFSYKWLLRWTPKKWKVKHVQEQGNLGHLRLRGHLEAVCVFDKNTGESDPWEVTEETLVMKEKHVPHQAEVVGKEGLCNQEGCDQ